MIYNNRSRSPEYPEQISYAGAGNLAAFSPVTGKTMLAGQYPGASAPQRPIFHGEALARDPQLESYGSWIVAGFTVVFALFLIGMNLAGQAPGQSSLFKEHFRYPPVRRRSYWPFLLHPYRSPAA